MTKKLFSCLSSYDPLEHLYCAWLVSTILWGELFCTRFHFMNFEHVHWTSNYSFCKLSLFNYLVWLSRNITAVIVWWCTACSLLNQSAEVLAATKYAAEVIFSHFWCVQVLLHLAVILFIHCLCQCVCVQTAESGGHSRLPEVTARVKGQLVLIRRDVLTWDPSPMRDNPLIGVS